MTWIFKILSLEKSDLVNLTTIALLICSKNNDVYEDVNKGNEIQKPKQRCKQRQWDIYKNQSEK